MKKIHDFVYSPGELTPDVVWYSVAVGASKRDQVAHGLLQKCAAKDRDCLYVVHTKEMADFQEKVAASFSRVGVPGNVMPLSVLRRVYINVVDLARCVRTMPLSYLNRPAATWGTTEAPIRFR